MTVLSVVAMILMTPQYVENWLLWVIVNVISVVILPVRASMPCRWNIFADVHCVERQPDVDKQRA